MSQSGLHEPAERPVGASQTFGNQGTRRPKPASLRRSVSAAYYAVFNLLIDSAARRIFAGSDRDALRDCLRRAFKHGSEAGLACIRVNYVATRRPGRDKPVPYAVYEAGCVCPGRAQKGHTLGATGRNMQPEHGQPSLQELRGCTTNPW